MPNFKSFRGTITLISDFKISVNDETGCYKLMSVQDGVGNVVNFVVSPTTYFVNHVTVTIGDSVTGYYDADAPTPMIYPPQFRAIVIAKDTHHQNVKVDYFDSHLLSRDGNLKLNISQYTPILLTNNQFFTKNPANRYLIVLYGPTTMSIPAQTTPYQVIVMC
ncbi:MAG TPA: hypothetical protein VJ824_10725 [Bacillota bacterium]|nr:hypothetical protein [Bacillota bacterium]